MADTIQPQQLADLDPRAVAVIAEANLHPELATEIVNGALARFSMESMWVFMAQKRRELVQPYLSTNPDLQEPELTRTIPHEELENIKAANSETCEQLEDLSGRISRVGYYQGLATLVLEKVHGIDPPTAIELAPRTLTPCKVSRSVRLKESVTEHISRLLDKANQLAPILAPLPVWQSDPTALPILVDEVKQYHLESDDNLPAFLMTLEADSQVTVGVQNPKQVLKTRKQAYQHPLFSVEGFRERSRLMLGPRITGSEVGDIVLAKRERFEAAFRFCVDLIDGCESIPNTRDAVRLAELWRKNPEKIKKLVSYGLEKGFTRAPLVNMASLQWRVSEYCDDLYLRVTEA